MQRDVSRLRADVGPAQDLVVEGEGFFDDGTAVPLNAPHPVALPDVADIVTRIVAGLDVLSKLPSPLINSTGVMLTATSVKLDDVTDEVTLVKFTPA